MPQASESKETRRNSIHAYFRARLHWTPKDESIAQQACTRLPIAAALSIVSGVAVVLSVIYCPPCCPAAREARRSLMMMNGSECIYIAI